VIGFIVFVFLAMFGLVVVWVLKYTREEAVTLPQAMVSGETPQIHEEQVQRTR
jgi:hypothetical protein